MIRCRQTGWLLLIGLVLRLAVAWADYGFVATDDHNHLLVDAVPAQRVPGPGAVVTTSGVRSPIPRLFVYYLAQGALWLGIEGPVDQIRFIYALMGVGSMLSIWLLWKLFDEIGQRDWGLHALVWTGMHFLAVFVSTRALIENMAAPFTTAAGVWLVYYVSTRRLAWLLASLGALAVASMFRFQVGICVVAIFLVPVLLRAWRDIVPLAAAGILLFAASGYPDVILRGAFHASLRGYVIENVRFSGTYGASAWYNYFLLLAATSLPPLLIARYRDFPWNRYARSLWPIGAMVGVFVLAHSLVPHKEDRFMIPILSLFLTLLAPLSAHLFADRPRSWRSAGFIGLNAVMFLAVAESPTQRATISFVRYLDEHPSIREVRALGDSLNVYPTAYSAREPVSVHRVSSLSPRAARSSGCDTIWVLREDLVTLNRVQFDGLNKVAVFEPGLLDKLLIVTNPQRNARRSALHSFVGEDCPLPE